MPTEIRDARVLVDGAPGGIGGATGMSRPRCART